MVDGVYFYMGLWLSEFITCVVAYVVHLVYDASVIWKQQKRVVFSTTTCGC